MKDIKNKFFARQEELFSRHYKQIDSLSFSKEYSFLIEEVIREIAGPGKYNFILASAGSFSRRELSPYSDIDLIFITESVSENEKKISDLVTKHEEIHEMDLNPVFIYEKRLICVDARIILKKKDNPS